MATTDLSALLRSLATMPSRRAVARALTGFALAGALSPLLGLTAVDAKRNKKKKRRRKKKRKKKCAEGQIRVGDQCVTGAGTCVPGANSCTSGPIFCNDSESCLCFQRLEDGDTRCGQPTDTTAPDQCGSDGDCLALGFPPGSSCIQDNGGPCIGTDALLGGCVAPCGSVAARGSSRTRSRRSR